MAPDPGPGGPDDVVLVDAAGAVTGHMPKLEAHQDEGHLHRAFSVFLVDGRDRVLLQRRSPAKHHFRGLWSNSCCSHPRPGEDVHRAAARRVAEELGVAVDAGDLHEVGTFLYRAEDPETGLVEHELDHVLVGRLTTDPRPDPDEADQWRWVTVAELEAELAGGATGFTPWFAPAWELARSGALGGETGAPRES